MKFSEIYEGWRNHLFPPDSLKEAIKKVAEERLAICDICPHNSKFHKTVRPDEHCVKCGCTLVAKVKCLSCECPLCPPRWGAIVTEEEEEIIEKYGEESNT